MKEKIFIARRLREFAYSKTDRLKDFAGSLDMSPQTLNSYLSGKISPGSELLIKLSDLGCDIDWLLTGSGKNLKEKESGRKATDGRVFRVLGTIPAGRADVQDWSELNEFKNLEYDPDTHFYLKIDEEFGYSMMPMVNPGDYVLVSLYGKLKDGDLVVALYDKTKGALKLYSESKDIPGIVILTSYNQAIPPMFFKKEQIRAYKVVLIEKKV
ncbi:MAG: helix-turn-helix domain-containing protein [Ignavibacteriales bacterium]|jgi:transcriptional regulator with XRE-family HTH domain|nr:helix-turn-helix domain-containing protein [Ignavibacteriales bacterium]MBK8661379.1 helix-turn-helix domain-containing protein [Ignavibacteriales bacterium]MBP7542273.1 helix-turn-helix domain-containing protein [Ignavibacteriaceae bacterium]MBP9122784.1 helix-turn-helix domain-containing protein [Ignavibacteriaceae bacterium]MCC6637169.1 helix-turn-helix domain-containing protein [Ignavibacteriaceae bacterium]